MEPDFARLLGTMTAVAMFHLLTPAAAAPPIWANAKWVKATSTTCGGVRYLVLKGDAVNVPTRSNTSGCTSSEEIFHQINVSKKFFHAGNKGGISGSRVDAGYIFCGKGEVAINLGAPGEAERAIREHPAPPGCSYTTRQYQYVSSVGSIPFTNVTNGGTMSVAESLAMHAREREQAIAECNASPACLAEVRRMSSFSGTSSNNNPCIANGNYSNYNGAGRCTDSNGNHDPSGAFVTPH
jgi:hypothetical protein